MTPFRSFLRFSSSILIILLSIGCSSFRLICGYFKSKNWNILFFYPLRGICERKYTLPTAKASFWHFVQLLHICSLSNTHKRGAVVNTPAYFCNFFRGGATDIVEFRAFPGKAGHPSLAQSIRHLPISFFLNTRSLKNFLRDLTFLGGGVGLSPQDTQDPIPVDALQVLNEPQGAFALVAEDGLPETRQEVRKLPLPDAFGPLPAHVDADDIHATFGKARHTSEIIYTAKKNDHIHHTHK